MIIELLFVVNKIMNNKEKFITSINEDNLLDISDIIILPKLEKLKNQGEIIGFNGYKISYRYYKAQDELGAVIILNGRAETYHKYHELCYNFLAKSYSVYVFDHRGQGSSDRLLQDKQKGHVDSFAAYEDDFNSFLAQIVKPNKHKNMYLLAHSMGAVIAINYLAKYPNYFKKIILSSPMLRINMANIPYQYGVYLVNFLCFYSDILKMIIRAKTLYFPFSGKYKKIKFSENRYTNSKVRFELIQKVFDERKYLQLGDPTSDWVRKAIKASEKAIKAAKKIITPMLILKAQADDVVDNTGIDKLKEYKKDVIVKNFVKSKHEILFEKDEIRDKALFKIFEFLEN